MSVFEIFGKYLKCKHFFRIFSAFCAFSSWIYFLIFHKCNFPLAWKSCTYIWLTLHRHFLKGVKCVKNFYWISFSFAMEMMSAWENRRIYNKMKLTKKITTENEENKCEQKRLHISGVAISHTFERTSLTISEKQASDKPESGKLMENPFPFIPS